MIINVGGDPSGKDFKNVVGGKNIKGITRNENGTWAIEVDGDVTEREKFGLHIKAAAFNPKHEAIMVSMVDSLPDLRAMRDNPGNPPAIKSLAANQVRIMRMIFGDFDRDPE